jgi:hypothetical protein
MVEFGTPYTKGSYTYWLNAMSVACVLDWAKSFGV